MAQYPSSDEVDDTSFNNESFDDVDDTSLDGVDDTSFNDASFNASALDPPTLILPTTDLPGLGQPTPSESVWAIPSCPSEDKTHTSHAGTNEPAENHFSVGAQTYGGHGVADFQLPDHGFDAQTYGTGHVLGIPGVAGLPLPVHGFDAQNYGTGNVLGLPGVAGFPLPYHGFGGGQVWGAGGANVASQNLFSVGAQNYGAGGVLGVSGSLPPGHGFSANVAPQNPSSVPGFDCPLCDKNLTRRDNVVRHLRVCHRVAQKGVQLLRPYINATPGH